MAHNRWLSLLGAALLFVASGAQCADDRPVGPGPCDDSKGQQDANECFGNVWRKADAELTQAYNRFRERLSDNPKGKTLLRDAERAWIKFRDANCAFRSLAVEGGSMQPMMYAMCGAEMTRDRFKHLQTQLDCEEGDPNCVAPSR